MSVQKARQGYKLVKSLFRKYEEIPVEWEFDKLSVIGQIIGGGTPDSTIQEYWNGDILWAVPTDITKLNSNFIDNTERKISEKGLNHSSAKLLSIGSVLITSRATIGECAINTKRMATNQGFQSLCCNKKNDNLFWLYAIKFHKKRLLRVSQGTTFLEISKNEIKKILIPSPTKLKEQQKIASILSNVDSLIDQTQKIIDQTIILKKGLIQKLLTKGIGHTKFKKVKNFFRNDIEIPEKWDYPKFSEVVKVNPQTKIEEKQVPYLPMDAIDVEKPHFNYFEERMLDNFPSLPKFRENDVLFASITPSTENGKTCIIENFSRKGIGSSELTVLRPSDKVVPKYLYYYVKSYRVRQFAISQMMGTTGRQRVPDYVFKKDLNFELPSYPEQQKIASILSNVDSQIQKQQEYKSKLETLKKGLMQKLLTGQIRVKV